MVGMRTKQQMAHINNSHLGLCLHPWASSALQWRLEWEVMANREVQLLLFHCWWDKWGWERLQIREKREGQSVGMLAMWRQGGAWYMVVWCHEIMP